MARINKVILIAGTRGTGKTDFTKTLVKKSNLPKKLIVDEMDNPAWHNLQTWDDPNGFNTDIPIINRQQLRAWRSGLYRIFDEDTDAMFSDIKRNVKNTFVVLEDATRYVGSKLTADLRRFMFNCKQQNNDLVFVFHSLGAIPPELVKSANYLILFKTGELIVSKNKYPFPAIHKALEKLHNGKNRFENIIIPLN